MARGPTWEERLQALSALEPTTSRTHQNDAVSTALADPHCRVVARAAALAAERSLHERIADLLARHPQALELDAEIATDALSVYDRNMKLMQRVREAQAGRKDTRPPSG